MKTKRNELVSKKEDLVKEIERLQLEKDKIELQLEIEKLKKELEDVRNSQTFRYIPINNPQPQPISPLMPEPYTPYKWWSSGTVYNLTYNPYILTTTGTNSTDIQRFNN